LAARWAHLRPAPDDAGSEPMIREIQTKPCKNQIRARRNGTTRFRRWHPHWARIFNLAQLGQYAGHDRVKLLDQSEEIIIRHGVFGEVIQRGEARIRDTQDGMPITRNDPAGVQRFPNVAFQLLLVGKVSNWLRSSSSQRKHSWFASREAALPGHSWRLSRNSTRPIRSKIPGGLCAS